MPIYLLQFTVESCLTKTTDVTIKRDGVDVTLLFSKRQTNDKYVRVQTKLEAVNNREAQVKASTDVLPPLLDALTYTTGTPLLLVECEVILDNASGHTPVFIFMWGTKHRQLKLPIEPLEIQRWFNRLHNKEDYGWTTVSKIRGIMNRIFKIGIIHKKVSKNPVEGLATSTKTTYKAIKITPAQTLLILRSVMGNMLHFTLVFLVAATALRSSEVLSLPGLTFCGKSGRSGSSSHGRRRAWTEAPRHHLRNATYRWAGC